MGKIGDVLLQESFFPLIQQVLRISGGQYLVQLLTQRQKAALAAAHRQFHVAAPTDLGKLPAEGPDFPPKS